VGAPMKPYYEHAGITIYHGDAARILPHLSPVDLLLTDPPYGIGEARKNHKSRGKLAEARDYGKADWDDAPPPAWLIEQARALARWQCLFGGNYFHLPPSKCWLVWDKENGTNDFADCELAWTNYPQAVRKLTYRWNGMLQEPGMPKEFRQHPTQKPEPVMRWALLQAPESRTILDPFMGSGTTLVAAKRLGRACVGIEREERYCEIAAKRLAQEALPLEAA
jgi:DNA modification methylase